MLLNFCTDRGILNGSQETEERCGITAYGLIRGHAKAAVNKKWIASESLRRNTFPVLFYCEFPVWAATRSSASENDFGKCSVTARVMETLVRRTPICRRLRASISALSPRLSTALNGSHRWPPVFSPGIQRGGPADGPSMAALTSGIGGPPKLRN